MHTLNHKAHTVGYTRYHNIEVLRSLDYAQERNTQVFSNGDHYILSPTVGEKANWFDIRVVNINRMNETFLLLVRIVPDKFILVHSKYISPLLTENLKDNRPHTGNVWGIKIDYSNRSPFSEVSLYNTKNSQHKLPVKLLDTKEMYEQYAEIKLTP